MLIITELMKKIAAEFQEAVTRYFAGEATLDDVHTAGKKTGVYPERNKAGESYTIRVRIPSGVISYAQLQKITEIAKLYTENRAHITTRQNIQLTGIKLKDAAVILNELMEVGISTLGTTGPGPRNITAPPMSGYEIGETFDIVPYALSAINYLLKSEENLSLAAKYQIGFSNSDKDYGKARISDLGFIADIRDGVKGFRVFGGGGMGGIARSGILLNEFIRDDEIYLYIDAMKRVLNEQAGIETVGMKVRTRHLLNKIGDDEFLKVFNQALLVDKLNLGSLKENSTYMEEKKYEVEIENSELIEECSDSSPDIENWVIKTKINGKYVIEYKPQSGNIDSEKINLLTDLISKLDYKTVIRVGMEQNILIIGVKIEDISKFKAILGEELYTNSVPRVVSCTGNRICRIGITDSRKLSEEIYKNISEISNLPDINISGCPSSCGKHHAAEIGFYGRKRREESGVIDVYRVFLGGNVHESEIEMAKEYGEITEYNVVPFLRELSDSFKESGKDKFKIFVKENREKIEEIVKRYYR